MAFQPIDPVLRVVDVVDPLTPQVLRYPRALTGPAPFSLEEQAAVLIARALFTYRQRLLAAIHAALVHYRDLGNAWLYGERSFSDLRGLVLEADAYCDEVRYLYPHGQGSAFAFIEPYLVAVEQQLARYYTTPLLSEPPENV